MFAVTPRLTLRPGWPEEATALAQAIGHEGVVRNLARAPWPYSDSDAQDFLSLPRGAEQPRFQIFERHGSFGLVGGIELIDEGRGSWELGYWLAPEAWGRGYATEAGAAVIDMARHALGASRIHARHFIDNPRSGAVLRKLGFVEAGRSRLHSLARGGEVACIDMVLDLCPASCGGTVSLAA